MVELRAPVGKFRVVDVDLFSHEDWVEGDFDTREAAFLVADENNKSRTGEMDTVYYVYDDKKAKIRDHTDVGELGINP